MLDLRDLGLKGFERICCTYVTSEVIICVLELECACSNYQLLPPTHWNFFFYIYFSRPLITTCSSQVTFSLVALPVNADVLSAESRKDSSLIFFIVPKIQFGRPRMFFFNCCRWQYISLWCLFTESYMVRKPSILWDMLHLVPYWLPRHRKYIILSSARFKRELLLP